MTYRDTGAPDAGEGTTASGDVDLERLRRTSPRRAARLEAERSAANGSGSDVPFDQQAPQQAPSTGTELFDQEAVGEQPTVEPVHEDVPHDASANGDIPCDQDRYDEVLHDEVLHDEVLHDEVPDDAPADDAAIHEVPHEEAADAHPFDEQAFHEQAYAEPSGHDHFGDPVRDGYVDTGVYVAPTPRRRRRGAGVLALVVLVAIVGGAGWFAYQGLRPVIGDLQSFELFAGAEDYEGAGSGTAEVVVSPGDTGTQMGRTLADADVVASVEAFVQAASSEPRFTSVQPGTYTLPMQIPAADAVAALLDPANRVNNTVVIAEGLRLDQILDRLAERTGLPREDLEAAVDSAELPAAAQGAEGLAVPAEGFLYPDGYQFGEDPTAEQVVAAMIARGQEVLADVGVAPEDQLEVLTKASLVQGEARLDDDFGRVAQVVDNRLAIDQPLGLDSTVNYATQTFDTRTTAEQRDSDSPYNTYRFPGLPPGPIKSPGRQAIEAVVDPTPGPWLYFVTVDLCTGETAFAESFEEHQDNVRVLNAWQRENTADDGSLICG